MYERQFQLNQIESRVLTQEEINMEEQRTAVRVDVEYLTEAITSAALRAVAQQPDVTKQWGNVTIRFGGMLDLAALQAQTGPALPQQEQQ